MFDLSFLRPRTFEEITSELDRGSRYPEWRSTSDVEVTFRTEAGTVSVMVSKVIGVDPIDDDECLLVTEAHKFKINRPSDQVAKVVSEARRKLMRND